MTESAYPLAPANPITSQGSLYIKKYKGKNVVLFLRPVSLKTDLPLLYRLMNTAEEVTGRETYSMATVRDSYKAVCKLGQSYLVTDLSGKSILQMDIFAPWLCDYEYSDGDFFIHFELHQETKHHFPVLLKAFNLCLDYFFSFLQVKRIITELPVEGGIRNRLALLSGFTFLGERPEPGITRIYTLPRRALSQYFDSN